MRSFNKNKVSRRRVLFCLFLGMFVTFLMVFSHRFQSRLLRHFDLKVYDFLLASRRGGTPSPFPVLVDIDEKSLAKFGQWPWPRTRLAELLAILAESGAVAIGVDILMAEPDRTSLGPLLKGLSEEYGLDPKLEGVPEEFLDNDALLADVLRQIPAVLSSVLVDGEGKETSVLKSLRLATQKTSKNAPGLSETLPQMGAVMPIPILMDAVSAVGYMTADPDEDGVMRRIPLFLGWRGSVQMPLSVLTLNMALGNGQMKAGMGENGLAALDISGVTIPLSGTSFLPIAFRGGRGEYPSWSAADILEGNVSHESFQDKIVFVGSSAAGLMDIRATPFDSVYPGLEMHAAVVDTILSERFISTPENVVIGDVAFSLQSFLIVLVGSLSMFLFAYTGPIAFLSLSVFSLMVLGGVSYTYFQMGFFVSPLYASLTVAAEGVSLLLARFWMETRERKALRAAFSNYVAPEIVRRIAEGEPVELMGEQREISVLFTDIRDFTSISESLKPSQLVSLLNRYFAPLTALVRESSGTLDKFVGDAMMAFWNAPLDVKDHPQKALLSAMEMKKALFELNAELQKELGFHLENGTGLHCGLAHVGNIGTGDLMSYTAIGDAVNVASRLEGMCSFYGVGITVSDDIMKQCRTLFYWQKIDCVRVKGRDKPVTLFTPLSEKEANDRAQELALWEKVQGYYGEGRFRDAGPLLTELRAIAPAEKLYRVFALRCAGLSVSLPLKWDGVYTHKSK